MLGCPSEAEASVRPPASCLAPTASIAIEGGFGLPFVTRDLWHSWHLPLPLVRVNRFAPGATLCAFSRRRRAGAGACVAHHGPATVTSQPGVESCALGSPETVEDSTRSLVGGTMRRWLSCKQRHRRRSSYEKGASQSGEGAHGEPEEEEAEATVGDGRLPQPPLPAESQPGTAAESGGPEGPASALAPPEPLTSQDGPPAAGQQPLPALSRPAPCPEITALVQELEAVREFQSCHRRERKKDLRSCQDCLRSLNALREHLHAVKGRLWRVEAKLGIRAPAQELDPEEEEGGDEGEGSQSSRSLAPLSVTEAPEEQNQAESSS